jgi:uncharacterized protein (TIGR04255 family)
MMAIMEEHPLRLPIYENAPVDEAFFGILHASLANYSIVVTRMRNRILAEYPFIQYQPRLLTGLEPLSDEPQYVNPATVPPQGSGRTWLIGRDDSVLVQLQDDRIIFNWRNRGRPYPHYDVLLETFLQLYSTYQAVLQDAGEGSVQAMQLEFGYINWTQLKVEEFLRPGASANLDIPEVDTQPTQQQWAGNYLVRRDSVPIGRLTAMCTAAIRLSGTPATGSRLELSFKAPISPDASIEEIRSAFGLAHSTTVLAFTQLTTDGAHETWVIRR